MTSLIEKLVTIIAPHRCIGCGIENNIVCDSCLQKDTPHLLPACCLCGAATKGWRICSGCSPTAALDHIWPAGPYDGHIAKVIHSFKFDRMQAAYAPLSEIMLTTLPLGDWLVMPIPTASTRIRQRGYDQTLLLARAIAKKRQLTLVPALRRQHNLRQVGTDRAMRQKQSATMFELAKNIPAGARILLVDDVCTTGSTLTAAARLLKAAGAQSVDAVVAAWQHQSESPK